MCHGCVWWSEGHGWTWFSPPTMWNPGIQRRFSGLVGTPFTIQPQSKRFHYVFITCALHLFPPAMCHAPSSLFVSDRPSLHPAHLEAAKFPRLTLHSLADVCQGPGGKPHTEPVQAVCCRFYQLQCAKKLQHGARATPSNMAGRSSRQRQKS